MSYGESDSDRRPTVTSAQDRSCVKNVAVEIADISATDKQTDISKRSEKLQRKNHTAYSLVIHMI